MWLKFGSGQVEVKIPRKDLLGVLSGRKMLPLSDPVKTVLDSLRPIGKTVKKGERVAIIVSDRTRSTGAEIFLPILLNELNSAGIPDQDIFIVFSLGAHPRQTRKQQQKIVGDETASRVKMFDHDCHDEKNLVNLGKTSRGTPVRLNRLAVCATRKIITSSITYHYFAGFGGGRKVVLPGIAAYESIQLNHRMSMDAGVCFTGKLDGNPLSEDMEEAAKMLKPDFTFNTVLNEEKKLCGIFAGDLISAHRAGCRFLNDYAMVKISQKADLVIAAAGGGGGDINFVQSHKAMENARFVLKEGGVMILLAESSEGFPSNLYLKYIEMGSAQKIHEELSRNFTVAGHTVYAAFQKAEKYRIIWVSKLPKDVVRKMGITPTSSFEEAYEVAKSWLNKNRKTYIMPMAYTTFPVLS